MSQPSPALSNPSPGPADPHGWRSEARDLLRAIAAGSIIGIPLLYTMEMWWRGTTVSEWHLLTLLAATLLLNFFFCLFIGFRDAYSPIEATSEAVTSVGVAIAFSLAILCLIGAVDAATSWRNTLAMTLIESFPVSLGISFANAQVRNRSRTGEDDKDNSDDDASDNNSDNNSDDVADSAPTAHRKQLREDLVDLAATVTGAVALSLSIAPTEEVLMIAARCSPWQLLALMAASLLICHLIIFASGFEGHRAYVPSLFQNPLVETTVAYAVSLAVALALLALIGLPETFNHPATAVACTITLGLPAVVGGAAGRLVT